ncbi:MAG TPA: CDP-glycerol glycerophosphotransferase family protein, partial [Microbacteriaceae bacterium]|nr:CDP-glycerol glycerophosphotransferase family protein [Microbacteriaceae bacterium]
RGPLAEQRYVIGVYFADSEVNLYQMRQWYAPLREISHRWPVLILARNAAGAEALIRESGLDVKFVPKVQSLESVIQEQPLKLVLYVNQNTRNFQMLRYGQRFHVFINHGESDKMYMVTNQIKAYDYALIAGKAARERLSAGVWNYDVAERTLEIGRPQTDHLDAHEKPFPEDDRIVVLYAPTWEGDRPAASYGSVLSHGEVLTSEILNSPRHRLIYRPHPRTGLENALFGKAHERIVGAIEQANNRDPQAHHVYDVSPTIDWQLSQADVAVCDISAMVYDRLATGKPVIVTRPASQEALVDEHGYLSVCEWLTVDSAQLVLYKIDRLLNDADAKQEQALWSTHYFGNTLPGEPSKRLNNALNTLLERWEQQASQRGADRH